MDDSIIVPIISICILVSVFVLILIIIWPDLRTPENIYCPSGLCRTNIYTGEKTCDERVAYNPAVEVCNPPDGCNSSKTPCVYNSETHGTSCPGDQFYDGLCPDGSTCKCVDRAICPDWVSVYFVPETVTTNGVDIFKTFVQNIVWNTPSGAPSNDQPISLGRYDRQIGTCGLSESNLGSIWPPEGCIRGVFGFDETTGLYYCMVDPGIVCQESQILHRTIDGTYICVG